MKTKHIFKILTIMMMLVLTVFTTGCESQAEKYDKASDEITTYVTQTYKELDEMSNKIAHGDDKRLSIETRKEIAKLPEKYIEKADNYEKNIKIKLRNLREIAKGDAGLERDAQLKIEEINRITNKITYMSSAFKAIRKK